MRGPIALRTTLLDVVLAPRRLSGLPCRDRWRWLSACWPSSRRVVAYLPLDTNYPAERLAFMVEDAAPLCLLTDSVTAAGLPNGAPRICLDDPAVLAGLAGEPSGNLTAQERIAPLKLSHPAYVIYTSGSTGRPKGVVVPHYTRGPPCLPCISSSHQS